MVRSECAPYGMDCGRGVKARSAAAPKPTRPHASAFWPLQRDASGFSDVARIKRTRPEGSIAPARVGFGAE